VVPFVPVVVPLPPEQLEPVNSGSSSHSDTDSDFVASESGEDEEEEDEDEAAAEADNRRRRKLEKVSQSGSGSGSGSEDEDEEDEDEEDEDEEDEEEEEDDEDEDAESETASQMLDGSDASAGARRRRQRRRRQSAKERTGLEAHERVWLKTFAASLDSLAKGGGAAAAAAAAAQRGGKRGGRRFKAPAPKKNAFSPVTLAQVQAGVVPATIAREQLAIEAQHQAQREELSRTPLLEPQSAESDPVRAANGGRPPTPRNHAALQSFVHAYILGLRSEEYHTTKRIVEQIRRFKHGEHDEDEDDDEEEGEDEEEEEEEDEDAEDEEEEDAEEEEGEDAEEEEEEEGNHSGEDPLHKFMRGLHKKNPRAARKERQRKRREAKAKAKASAGAGDEDADATVDAGDITIENVEESMSALALGAPAQAGSAAAAASDSSTSPAPSAADSTGAGASSGLSFPALVPAVRSAAEAALMSHSQGAMSPSPNDAHHAVAHKHAIKHASEKTAAGAADNASAAAQPAQPHHHKQHHPKHHHKHKHGARKADEAHDDDEDEEEEEEEGEDEDGERSGYASEHSGSAVTGSHRSGSGSGSGSGSQRSRTSSTSSWQDALPYEKNLFSLAPSYHFIKRLYSCADAVTYKAYSKLTNKLVAIKICDGYDSSGTVVPKEVRLLNRAQGHPNVCVMNGWHPFPSNGYYAIITEFIENEPIETLFDRPELHKVYMRSVQQLFTRAFDGASAGVAALSSRGHLLCAPAVLFLAGTCCADCNTCITEASVHHPSHGLPMLVCQERSEISCWSFALFFLFLFSRSFSVI
jgi:hypothetical protein